MRRPSRLVVFALSAFAWLVVLTLAWTTVSRWTSWPVGGLSSAVLEAGAPGWVRSVHTAAGVVEVESDFEIFVPNAGGRRAAVIVEGSPARYAYGLPIFLALLFAARSSRLWWRAPLGYVLLLPTQAFSLTFHLLMQLVMSAQGSPAALRAPPWQLELITYGYQLGVLVLPTLTPVLIWLWLDRRFVTEVLIRDWQQRLTRPVPQLTPEA